MRISNYAIPILFLGLAGPVPLYAWGKDVHRIIGEIAEEHLTQNTRRLMKSILGEKHTLGSVADWPDGIKRKFPKSGPYHYVNIPLEETDVRFEDYEGETHLREALHSYVRVLGFVNTTPEQKREALRWVVHLMGDMHQPLHVSDNGDKGGNTAQVVFQGKSTNLHALWDTGLIRHYYKDPAILENEISRSILPVLGMEHFGRGDIDDWLRETQALARDCYTVETVTIETRDTLHLPGSYGTKSLITQKAQIKKAALRLATVLNRTLGAKPNFTVFQFLYNPDEPEYHHVDCAARPKWKAKKTWYANVRPYDKAPHQACVPPEPAPKRKSVRRPFVAEAGTSDKQAGYIRESAPALTEEEMEARREAQKDLEWKLRKAEEARQKKIYEAYRDSLTLQVEYEKKRMMALEKALQDSLTRLVEIKKAEAARKHAELNARLLEMGKGDSTTPADSSASAAGAAPSGGEPDPRAPAGNPVPDSSRSPNPAEPASAEEAAEAGGSALPEDGGDGEASSLPDGADSPAE